MAALLGLALFAALARSVVTRIGRYSAFAGALTEGDLTQLLEPKGSDKLAELAVHLNRMVEAQSSASGQMSEGATTLSSSTAEMLVTVNQNTAAASEQSAAIQEVSATVEELRATAEQAAATAEDVAAKSQARRMGSGRHSTPSRTSSAAWATSP